MRTVMPKPRTVRVAVYGAGHFAKTTHIPNLMKIDGVEIVAVCDTNPDALRTAAETFSIERAYQDAHEMLAQVEIDALFSIVPAYARTDVEAAAALKGIHLFSEKPQAMTMRVARRIDEAVRASGVISTVGFRERYRPLFQEARRLLADKRVTHIRFQQVSGYPGPSKPGHRGAWGSQMDKGGVRFFDWGVHATDYARFMSGQNVTRAQAFLCQPDGYPTPLSSSFHYALSNGATMTLTFVESDPTGLGGEPWFTVYFEGGRIALFGYERIEMNGKTVYQAETYDPWFEQDRRFIEAVRTGDASGLLNDYHDGLFSLAPVLAGWASSRRNGACIDVAGFMAA